MSNPALATRIAGRYFAAASFALALAGMASAQAWVPTFGKVPGTNGSVNALLTRVEDGRQVLYAGGSFTSVGGIPANRVARWDGVRWAALGEGMNRDVLALAVFDDGNGEALYAGGNFNQADGAPALSVARWDGTSWTPVGAGMDQAVTCLAVFDDGSGPALFAGGFFNHADDLPARRVARWNGSNWTGLGGGMNDDVLAMATFDDGGGNALYLGGVFGSADGVQTRRVARFDGTSWSEPGQGLQGLGPTVYALTVLDDGGSKVLVAGGNFKTSNGVTLNGIARWNGTAWSPFGSAGANVTTGVVKALTALDLGAGQQLYAGGTFSSIGGVPANQVGRWDGASWNALGGGTGGEVLALTPFEDCAGPRLFVGGNFTLAGGLAGQRVAAWDGAAWTALDRGIEGLVRALATFDDGHGPALYVGGGFRGVGNQRLERIGRWDAAGWTPLGGGLNSDASCMVVHDDGGGPALYVGGSFNTAFNTAGGLPANSIARWDGASWSSLGSGTLESVEALAVFDDGGGPALIAGGTFSTIGGVSASRVAKWDGSTWAPLGSGLNRDVAALAVFDDGGGPALYAGGLFTGAGGLPASRIARWDGASWTPLGSGVSGSVTPAVDSLAVFDDGSGPALYAGGTFKIAGGLDAKRIARWNGVSWSPLGGGLTGYPDSAANALRVFDDGSGPALYVGGFFNHAGGIPAERVARWDGTSWSALGGGLSEPLVLALGSFDDGTGPALFAGGDFARANDSCDSFLAKWGSAPLDSTAPTLCGPTSVTVLERFGTPPGEIVTFAVTAADDRDPLPELECLPPSGTLFPLGTTIVTCTATDASGNQGFLQFPVTVQRKARRR